MALRQNAKHLRSHMTDAEKRLWYHLRAYRLLGLKFRRQMPIGPYVVDFACVRHALVIEVDGSQHQQNAHDAVRDHYLQQHGWRVLRFWNHEVLAQTPAVLEAIRLAVLDDTQQQPSPPTPLPQAGEGSNSQLNTRQHLLPENNSPRPLAGGGLGERVVPASTLPPYKQGERGVALFTVMVVVLLSMLLALLASRTALFNEMIVGNDADYQRAYEAAQAMLQDAENDIRGIRADGKHCLLGLDVASKSPAVCRCADPGTDSVDRCKKPDINNARDIAVIPRQQGDLDSLFAFIAKHGGSMRCKDALCVMRPSSAAQDFWTGASFDAWKAAGARYGQYTGAAPLTTAGASDTDNPVLKNRAWYWIEIGKYQELLFASSEKYPPFNPPDSVVYRITAIAQGIKPGTQVVLQEIYVNHNP